MLGPLAQPPTLRSIGQQLGLSPATVSRVLSGQGQRYRISQSTQDAVLALARKSGYVAHEPARQLRLRRTATLGLVIPDVANPFFARIAQAVTRAARQCGYTVLVQDSQDSTEVEIEELDILRRRHVEGIVLCPVGLKADHLVHLGGLPIVLADRVWPSVEWPCITSDNVGGTRQAVERLFALGHRRIACLQGLPGTSTNDERLTGYRLALKVARLRFDSDLVTGQGFGEVDGYQAARELLENQPRVTAWIAFGNMIALGALRALAESGRRLPDDLSLIAFDDSPYAAHLACPLTTIAQDPDALGQRAVTCLLNGPHRALTERLPTRLVERASIAPPRKE